jgi:GNAT superfamily N-acetyltransferase
MSLDPVIRSMEKGEEGEVCTLVERVFNEFVAPDYPPEGIEEFFRYAEPEAMAQRVELGDRVLVAEQEGAMVGMIELMGNDHIAMLFVQVRGRGIGRRLVERALLLCREASPPPDEVRVHASRFAVPIYERLGFESEGPERTENGITYLPMVYRFINAPASDG